MSVAALPRVDPYVEEKENFAYVDPLWLANLVDTLNSMIQQVEDRLVSGGL